MSSRKVRTALIVAGAAIAMLFVFAATASLVMARSDPERALGYWRSGPALAGRAARLVDGPATPTEARDARALGIASLRRSPVDPIAARAVALSYASQGDMATGRRWIGYGEALSRRDVPTQLWMIEDRVAQDDIGGAMVHYHRAMQTSPEVRKVLLPVLAAAADDPAIIASFGKYLAQRPEYWSDFVGRFAEQTVRPSAIAAVQRYVRLDPASPIDRPYIVQLLNRFVHLEQFAAARLFYRQVMGQRSSQEPAVVDGGFGREPRLPPFEWAFSDDPAHAAIREEQPGGHGNVLSIDGVDAQEAARQLLTLAPGRYRLTALVGNVSAGLMTPPTMSVACTRAANDPLTVSAFALTPRPRPIATVFEVPAQNCAGQWLTIVAAGSAGYLTQVPWIDDVTIVRIGR